MEITHILTVIDKMQEEWYKVPTTYYRRKKVDFEYQSYKRSAMDEIKKYLIEHKDEDPIDAMENFRHQMDCFACETKNGNANFMFSIYYDVATDVLDHIIWNKINKKEKETKK